jgi:MarR family transcriptional regulator, organic hydroperoxide resistance regulator
MSAIARAPLAPTAGTGSPAVAANDSLEAQFIATIAPLMRHLVAHARRRPTWRQEGLTYQQYNVLRVIDTQGPIGQAEVARRLLVTAPVVTRLATTLAEGGLLVRRPDPKDRRAVKLALTPAGRRRARAMRAELLEAARELLEPLPREHREAVEAALGELQILLPQHSGSR